MGRDARQSSADEARNLLAAADNVVSLGIRRPQEGEAHAKEAVLSRPTPDTKLGLTLTDLGDGQVVIHQVYEGYKAACLQASDFVISVNGELVDTEPQATPPHPPHTPPHPLPPPPTRHAPSHSRPPPYAASPMIVVATSSLTALRPAPLSHPPPHPILPPNPTGDQDRGDLDGRSQAAAPRPRRRALGQSGVLAVPQLAAISHSCSPGCI